MATMAVLAMLESEPPRDPSFSLAPPGGPPDLQHRSPSSLFPPGGQSSSPHGLHHRPLPRPWAALPEAPYERRAREWGRRGPPSPQVCSPRLGMAGAPSEPDLHRPALPPLPVPRSSGRRKKGSIDGAPASATRRPGPCFKWSRPPLFACPCTGDVLKEVRFRRHQGSGRSAQLVRPEGLPSA